MGFKVRKTILKMFSVCFYEMTFSALLNTRPAPILIGVWLFSQTKTDPSPSLRKITVADGLNADRKRVIEDIPVTFADQGFKLILWLINGVPADLLI